MATLGELFAGAAIEGLPETILHTEIHALEVDKPRRLMKIEVGAPAPLASETIEKFEHAAKQALGLHGCEVAPVYPPESFDCVQLPALIFDLRRRGQPVNGFF